MNALYDVYISTHASAWIINLIAHRRRNVETNPTHYVEITTVQYTDMWIAPIRAMRLLLTQCVDTEALKTYWKACCYASQSTQISPANQKITPQKR